LFIISFVEGGVLLSYEVLSAKIYTPYLGASIYVWTSILTVTLIGLAIGYWFGGKFSLKNPKKYLLVSLGGAGVLVILSTSIAETILPSLIDTDIKSASIMAGVLILFFPVLLMGMVSPLIIGILNLMKDRLSSATGLIYGIGTIGGIILLLITIFNLIPTIGVKNSSYVLGAGLLIAGGISTTIKISEDEET
jgi:hypothetical protein